jgi:LmbE family N-acetylglucosaminyl deacetylase
VKKTAVAIFAHPDDEAFGPSGTIYKLSKKYDLYLLCATRGEIGIDSSRKNKSLAETRSQELRKSAKILGVKKVYFLGFIDGALSNSLYHKLADAIEKHLKILKPDLILTSNPNGGSGHIDHIVVSMVSSFIFERLEFVKKIMYTANTKEFTDKWKNKPYFVYRPDGIPRSEIDEIVDVSDVWDIKIKAMEVHESQRHDYERIIEMRKGMPREEYFLVKIKSQKSKVKT